MTGLTSCAHGMPHGGDASCVRACAHRIIQTERADDDQVLIVEERLRLSLTSIACLKRLARLTVEPTGIPLLSDLERFARFTRELASAVETQLRAIKAALPVSATNLDAPVERRRA